MRPVALLALKMQKTWDDMLSRSPDLASPSDSIWASYDGATALLPLHGALSRLLLVGVGGVGKSRIINLVYTQLLEAYYGPDGLLKEAPSNKAARGIHGVTSNVANNLIGNSYLLVPPLGLKPRQPNFVRRMGRLGAKL